MKIRNALILGIALLFGTAAFAQDSDHKIEITADYSYIHANPQNNNIIPTFSLNGGGGSGVFYFSKYIGTKGNLKGMQLHPQRYYSRCEGICLPTTSVRSLSSGHRISNHCRGLVRRGAQPFIDRSYLPSRYNLLRNNTLEQPSRANFRRLTNS
ncbi:MAG: hypothetical protein WAK48_28905 [Candidatus Acidiferrum sp.]